MKAHTAHPAEPVLLPQPAPLFKQAYSALCRGSGMLPDPGALPPLPPDDSPSAVPEPRWRAGGGTAPVPAAAEAQPSLPCYDYTPQSVLRLAGVPRSAGDWELLLEAFARSRNVVGLEVVGAAAAAAVTCDDGADSPLLALGGRLARREMPSLTSLAVELSSYSGGSVVSPARPIALAGLLLNEGLRRLSLRGAGLTATDAAALGRALAVNTRLECLLLGHNPLIGDAGVSALADGLRDNRSLCQLGLGDVGLTDTVLPGLAAALTRYTVDGPRAGARARFEAAAAETAATTAVAASAAWPFPVLMGADDAIAAAVAQQTEAAAVRAATTAALAPVPPAVAAESAAAAPVGRGTGAGKAGPAAGTTTTTKPAASKPAAPGAAAVAVVTSPPQLLPFSPAAACPLPPLRLESAPSSATTTAAVPAQPPSPAAAPSARQQGKAAALGAKASSAAAAAAAADAAAAAAATAALSAAYADESARFAGVGCGGSSLRLLDVSHNPGVTRAGLVGFLRELAACAASGADASGGGSGPLALATVVAVGCGAPPPEEVDEAAIAAAAEEEQSGPAAVVGREGDEGELARVAAELRARGLEVVLAL